MKSIATVLAQFGSICLSFATATTVAAQQVPDVLGFRLGMTYPEVRARITEMKLNVSYDGVSQVRGLPNSSFRPLVDASDLTPNGTLSFAFTAPPSESRLVAVTRVMNYQSVPKGSAPSSIAVTTALMQKFGKPTASNAQLGRMTWIWSPTGALLSRDPGTPCTFLATGLLPRAGEKAITDQQKRLIEAGCGTFVQVEVTADSAGVVTNIDQMAIDVVGGDRARRQTADAVSNSSTKQNADDLNRASKQKPSI